MQIRYRWSLFWFLCLLLVITISWWSMIVATTSAWMDHVIGGQEDISNGLPDQQVSSVVSWVGFVSEGKSIGYHDIPQYIIGQPHVDNSNGEWSTISFRISSSVPTKNYPTLRALLQDGAGVTVRFEDYSPDSYSHGNELTSETIVLTLHIHPSEQRVSIQAR